ncbi:MAG TPA: hypothetical protein VLD67_00960, partial [Vicinamibacterales bacterium]|nr:hypothetical protein [Vicinamibacterales bacterium]
MRFRTWPVAALALCGLLLLVVFSLLTASRRAQEIYTQLDQLNTHHRQVDAKLRQLRSHVHLSGIFVRDYLLDPEQSAENRQRLAEFRSTNRTTLVELVALTQGGGDETNSNRMATLQAQLDEYWKAFDPLFDSTTAGELARASGFLRSELIPRREAVLAIAQEIELLNNASLDEERAEVAQRHGEFRSDLLKLLWQSLLL